MRYHKVFLLVKAIILWRIDMKLILLVIVAMLALPLNAVADQIAEYNESAKENTTEFAEISEGAIEYKLHECDAFSLEYPANWLVMDLTDMANYLFESLDQPIEGTIYVAYLYMEMPTLSMVYAPDEENTTTKGFAFGIDNTTPPTYTISFDDSMLTLEGAPNEIIKHAVETIRIKNQTESIP